MALPNNNSSIKTILIFWEECIGRLKVKLTELAIFLDTTKFIYIFYGAADGLNLCYSAVKYFFDFKNNLAHVTSNVAVVKDYQNWFKNADTSLIIMLASSAIFIFLSIIGNFFKESRATIDSSLALAALNETDWEELKTLVINNKSTFGNNTLYESIKNIITLSEAKKLAFSKKQFLDLQTFLNKYNKNISSKLISISNLNKIFSYISDVWPYIRDSIKGIKNAYKGWRSALSLTLIFHSSKQLLLPLGICFGILSLSARIMKRSLVTLRKNLQESNEAITAIYASNDMNSSLVFDAAQQHNDMLKKNNMNKESSKLYLIAIYGGFIDSLYLHMGFIAMGPLSPIFFSIISSFCLAFIAFHVLARLYEENMYQKNYKFPRIKH